MNALSPIRRWTGLTTEGRVQMVIAHWSLGYSAKQIAMAISDATGEKVSRHAIIGLYHRQRENERKGRGLNPLEKYPLNPVGTHGLSIGGFALPSDKAPLPPKPRRDRIVKLKAAAPEPSEWVEQEAPYSPEGQPISNGPYGSGIPHPDDGCMWPTGHDGDQHLFCGAARQVKSPYCAPHRRQAYRTAGPEDE